MPVPAPPKALLLAALGLLPTLLTAQDAAPAGDAAAGAAVFGRQCVACHVVQAPSGEVLAGRSARTGPNLYGVASRVPGSHSDYAYSDAMEAYGATGAAWEEANLVPYVQDPTGFLRDALGDPRARGKMAYKVRDEEDARDVYAFLAALSAEGGQTPAAE